MIRTAAVRMMGHTAQGGIAYLGTMDPSHVLVALSSPEPFLPCWPTPAPQVQFYMKGPSGTGLVNADMYKDSAGHWQYTYLLVDVYTGSSQNPSRVYIIKPQ
jgi:hypothetical protein